MVLHKVLSSQIPRVRRIWPEGPILIERVRPDMEIPSGIFAHLHAYCLQGRVRSITVRPHNDPHPRASEGNQETC